MNTTPDKVIELIAEGLRVTTVRPGLIAANNGRWMYRYEQTSKGWRRMSLGPMLSRG